MTEPLSAEDDLALDAACDPLLSRDDEPEQPLWHFTGPDGLKGIVESSSIRATHYGFTNDAVELTEGEQAVLGIVDALAENEPNPVKRNLYIRLKERLPDELLTKRADVYLACFTEAGGNDLIQWSGYGARGSGYAVALHITPPADDNPDATFAVLLARCIYKLEDFSTLVYRQLGRYAQVFADFKGAGDAREHVSTWMLRECAALTPRLKHKCFEHEREWRLVVIPMADQLESLKLVEFRTGGANGLTPYVEVPLGEKPVRLVVVGPVHGGLKEPRLAAARMLLAKHGYDPAIGKWSGIPFRG